MSNFTSFPLRQAHKPLVVALFNRIFAGVGRYFSRLRAVNELSELSDRQLRDIGVERRQIEAIAEREIAKLKVR
jgi:uncharacterized protein YjiS (DUF1127 family)